MGMVFENRPAWVPNLDERPGASAKRQLSNGLSQFERITFTPQKFETCPDWGAKTSAVDNTGLYAQLGRQGLFFFRFESWLA